MLKYEVVHDLDHQVSAPKLLGNLCQLFCGADKTCLQAPAAAAAAAQLPPCSQLCVYMSTQSLSVYSIFLHISTQMYRQMFYNISEANLSSRHEQRPPSQANWGLKVGPVHHPS